MDGLISESTMEVLASAGALMHGITSKLVFPLGVAQLSTAPLDIQSGNVPVANVSEFDFNWMVAGQKTIYLQPTSGAFEWVDWGDGTITHNVSTYPLTHVYDVGKVTLRVKPTSTVTVGDSSHCILGEYKTQKASTFAELDAVRLGSNCAVIEHSFFNCNTLRFVRLAGGTCVGSTGPFQGCVNISVFAINTTSVELGIPSVPSTNFTLILGLTRTQTGTVSSNASTIILSEGNTYGSYIYGANIRRIYYPRTITNYAPDLLVSGCANLRELYFSETTSIDITELYSILDRTSQDPLRIYMYGNDGAIAPQITNNHANKDTDVDRIIIYVRPRWLVQLRAEYPLIRIEPLPENEG